MYEVVLLEAKDRNRNYQLTIHMDQPVHLYEDGI